MKKEVEKTVAVLNNGGVILYPTDTVWGLGCDATNLNAVQKLFKIKKRLEDKSVIALVDNFEKIKKYADCVDEKNAVIFSIDNKPTTVILPKGKNMVKGVINQNGSVAFRIPNHQFCQACLKTFQKPLVSTSANISGEKTPVYFKEISNEIKSLVDYVVSEQYEENSTHKPSRILLLKETGEILTVRE